MSKTELKTTNKKILDFYNTNSIFNFDVMNELLVDVLQEITKHITGNITNNMSHKLNKTLSLQTTELNDIKTQLSQIVNDNINKTQFYKDLNKDLFNQLLLQLHELKKDNITNFKELIANNQNTQLHNINIFIQNENESIYIPDYYFHGVINLTNCYGFTYIEPY
jgi:CheY-specific phosphatase CheX